jgi:hypothetical protein
MLLTNNSFKGTLLISQGGFLRIGTAPKLEKYTTGGIVSRQI